MRNPFGPIEIDTVLSPARRKLFHYFWVTFALLLIFSTRPLWMGAGEYPQVPFAGGLVNAGRTADHIAFGLAFVPLCLMLVIGDSSRVWRACCGAFLCGMGGLFLLDQHRFQPWVWQFVLIGCASLWFPTRSVAYWWRWLAISIYLFSAISKFDVSFADELGLLFLRTVGSFISVDVSAWPLVLQRIGGLSFPVWEFAVGLMLCFPRTRFAGMWMAWGMHGMLLAILGPWGLNHHWGVLLWNGFFICQAGLLFWPCMYQGPSCPLRVPGGEKLSDLKGRVGAVAMTVILWLPVLEPLGLYDHWPSWGLYASHVERVNLFIHREARGKLPTAVLEHLSETDDPEWLRLKLDRWSLAALKAPIYPQGRFQIGVCAAVIERYRLQEEFRVVYEGAAGRLTGNRRAEEFRTSEELQMRVEGFRLNARPRMGTFGR